MTAARALALLAVLMPASATALPPLVNVCWDYGCDRNARIVVPPGDWADIRALFRPPASTAAAERTRIARAIARFERTAGRLTGTHRDRYENVAGSGLPGQMDCIDESRNTDAYLRLLAEHDLLRWHDVAPRRKRMRWVLDQHWTAVVVDRATGTAWAIDSWFLDNGHRPYVQRLDAWLDMDALPPNPDAAGGRTAGRSSRWERQVRSR
jgi:hypothetical protein